MGHGLQPARPAKTWARGLACAPRTFRAMKTVLALMAKVSTAITTHITRSGVEDLALQGVGKHQRGCCCHRWLNTPFPKTGPRDSGCLPLTGASFLAVGLGARHGRPPSPLLQLGKSLLRTRPGGRAMRRVRGLGSGGCPSSHRPWGQVVTGTCADPSSTLARHRHASTRRHPPEYGGVACRLRW